MSLNFETISECISKIAAGRKIKNKLLAYVIVSSNSIAIIDGHNNISSPLTKISTAETINPNVAMNLYLIDLKNEKRLLITANASGQLCCFKIKRANLNGRIKNG